MKWPHHEKTCSAICEQQSCRSTCASVHGAFVVRCLDNIIPLVSISEISSLCLASVAAQAGLSLLTNPRQVFS